MCGPRMFFFTSSAFSRVSSPRCFLPAFLPSLCVRAPLRCFPHLRYAVALDLEEEAGNVLRTGDTVRAVP